VPAHACTSDMGAAKAYKRRLYLRELFERARGVSHDADLFFPK